MFGRRVAAIEEDTSALEGQLADFFGLHYDRLVRLAALVCHANVSIEDAVQAAMEQAWRRRHTLRDPNRLRPWLDQIVVREAIRLNRRPWWTRFAGVPRRGTGDGARSAGRGRSDVDRPVGGLPNAPRRAAGRRSPPPLRGLLGR